MSQSRTSKVSNLPRMRVANCFKLSRFRVWRALKSESRSLGAWGHLQGSKLGIDQTRQFQNPVHLNSLETQQHRTDREQVKVSVVFGLENGWNLSYPRDYNSRYEGLISDTHRYI